MSDGETPDIIIPSTWIETQQTRIKEETHERFCPWLEEKLNAVVYEGSPQTSFEVTLNRVLQLQKQVETCENNISTAAQSPKAASDAVELFWAKFKLKDLENPKFLIDLNHYFDDQVRQYQAETDRVNDTISGVDEILKEVEPELQNYAHFYFNTTEREKLYLQKERILKIKSPEKREKTLNTYQIKLVKQRQTREQYAQKSLATIQTNYHRPLFCQRLIQRLEKKCGSGIFDLPNFKRALEPLDRALELFNAANTAKEEAESYNETFFEEFRHPIPGFKRPISTAANDNEADDSKVEKDDDSELPAENTPEAIEFKKKVLMRVQQLATERQNFWNNIDPSFKDDPSFSIPSGKRIQVLMEAHPDKLLNHDEYLAMERAANANLSVAQDDPTAKEWHYRTIDIPENVEDFTVEKAAALNARLDIYTQGDKRLLYLTGLFYIDYQKRGATKAKSVSMSDYGSHINNLCSGLSTSSLAQAA